MGDLTPDVTLQDDNVTDDNQNTDITVEDNKQDDGSVEDDVKSDVATDEVKPVDNPADARDNEILELRQMVRDQRRDIQALANDRPAPSEDADEDDDEVNDEDKSTDTQVDLRTMKMELNLENMRMSDKYGDVDKVVTQRHFDDVIEMLSDEWISKNPGQGTRNEIIAELEQSVWEDPFAHRQMYNKIKEIHPDYTKPNTPRVKLNEEVVVPSINNIAGGQQNLKTGWTAAKINDLPENRLGEVPRDVYDLYMQDKLK